MLQKYFLEKESLDIQSSPKITGDGVDIDYAFNFFSVFSQR